MHVRQMCLVRGEGHRDRRPVAVASGQLATAGALPLLRDDRGFGERRLRQMTGLAPEAAISLHRNCQKPACVGSTCAVVSDRPRTFSVPTAIVEAVAGTSTDTAGYAAVT